MSTSTLETAPHHFPAWGAVSNAEASGYPDSAFIADILHRANRGDYHRWLEHISAAAACTRPIRLRGTIYDVRKANDTAEVFGIGHTDTMPDGVIYKACGNRRASICPACSKTYQQDAYQIIRAGIAGGKTIPTTVVKHPAVFATLTAPSFGPVHTRIVRQHACAQRKHCTCRAEPCHARRDTPKCPHGRPKFCFTRHQPGDSSIGKPICLDCYDHEAHVTWNRYAAELWRRTKQAIDRNLARKAKQRGIPHVTIGTNPDTGKPVTVPPVRVACGKAAEFQARGVVHFHTLMRIDGVDPDNPTAIVPPPDQFDADDLHDAIRQAAQHIALRTPTHADKPEGWHIRWGDFDKAGDVRTVTLQGDGQISDTQVAGYLAKYMTKSTEAVGLSATRFTEATIHQAANFGGNHIQRLLAACWKLGRPLVPTQSSYTQSNRLTMAYTCLRCQTRTALTTCPGCQPHQQVEEIEPDAPPKITPDDPLYFRGLQRWTHMLGFGGHTFTQSRRYSITFTYQRNVRTSYRRNQAKTPQPPQANDTDMASEDTILVISTLAFAGVGWHTTADAMLANTAAALAREQQQTAREELAHQIATRDSR